MNAQRQLHTQRLREALERIPAVLSGGNALSPTFRNWQERTRQSLSVLFGDEHAYTRQFGSLQFWLARVSLVGGTNWVSEDQERYVSDLERAQGILKDALEELGATERFQTELPSEDSSVWRLMHPRIVEISRRRFDSQHYADAVEAAFKEVNSRVKAVWIATGRTETDGVGLMFKAFDLQNPAIRLARLDSQTGRDIQEGYKHIFAGAMMAIRNPKAHDNIVISPERALQLLGLASLLMYTLDEAGNLGSEST